MTIPRVAAGDTVAVLASGPSMSQAVADRIRLRRIRAIVVNNTHRLAPWAWALHAADEEFWRHPETRDAQQFPGLKFSFWDIPGVTRLKIAGIEGWTDAADSLHTYSNSGAQAIQIAIKSGAKRVELYGFDLHRRDGDHWHGAHPAGLRNTTEEQYALFRRRFEVLARNIPAGVEVVNCTPGSALDCFPCRAQ